MKLNRFLFISGILLTGAGTAASFIGYRGVAFFLSSYDNTSDTDVLALLKGLIVPHVFMLLGIGMIAFGVIMIARGFFFMKRIESYDK